MTFFTRFYLDHERDLIVNLYQDLDRLFYELETPNHNSGNLIRNLAKLCGLPLSRKENDLLVIRGEVPCYVDANNEEIYIFRLGNTKMANIYPDGRVEMKAAVPAISKTLMSQTRDYKLDISKTIFKTYIRRELKFHSDLHTHMNGNLQPDVLIALGICHQIRYPLYYVRKLGLRLTDAQEERLAVQREKVAKQFVDSDLVGKYLDRRINDNTFINFADLILGNLNDAAENIGKIRISLVIMKDGQAVFTNLEKVYLYRYVFTKGQSSEERISLQNIGAIPDESVRDYCRQMQKDGENSAYHDNTLFQDKLLWIARYYKRQGVSYAEISDTTLLKKYESIEMLRQVHEVMPQIYRETGVMIRFLAAFRRIPLTIIKDSVTPENYLVQNLRVLQAVALDPYVAGCDFVGEEINDIITLKPIFREIARIAAKDPDFVVRIHAGENDSQKDNIAHSIACVKDSLAPGQQMPHMRLGHGLYTYSLRSAKGKKVLQDLRENNIVLEFQLTSNVRLNNLNALDKHPLRQYIKAGIPCVQGSDGAALYGTNSIDEQLALEKLLGLSEKELAWMKQSETDVIRTSREAYSRKKRAFEQFIAEEGMEKALLSRMESFSAEDKLVLHSKKAMDSYTALKEQVHEFPWDKLPIVIVGGSFNTEKRTTRVTEDGKRQVEALMDTMNPEDVFFVIGHKLKGYEKYLVENNRKHFQIFSVIPSRIDETQLQNLKHAGVYIRVSPESEGMGIYKSFNYEIFERRPSLLIGLDGNSAGTNLMQEARNGKGRARIYIWDKAKALKQKADSLEGYVHFFDEENSIAKLLQAKLD